MRPLACFPSKSGLSIATALLLACSPLRAQANPDSVKQRNDCRLAEQVLTTGEPATHRTEALSVIGLCGSEGVPALLSAWSSSTGNRGDLELLLTSTRAFINPQVVEALFSTLAGPDRPLDTRVASLLVLITFADSTVVPGFDNFTADSTTLLLSRYGRVDHAFPTVGREAYPQPLTERLREAVRAVATADPDPRMRLAARLALQNAPLRP